MIKKFVVLALIACMGLLCSAVFAGGGVSPQLPDFGFAWPQWVVSVGNYLDVLTSVIGSFALFAAITPNKYDNIVAQVLRVIVDFLGANFYNAKNQQ